MEVLLYNLINSHELRVWRAVSLLTSSPYLIKDIVKQASFDSQRLHSDIKALRESMDQMKKTIEVKHDNIVRELVPKIEQL